MTCESCKATAELADSWRKEVRGYHYANTALARTLDKLHKILHDYIEGRISGKLEEVDIKKHMGRRVEFCGEFEKDRRELPNRAAHWSGWIVRDFTGIDCGSNGWKEWDPVDPSKYRVWKSGWLIGARTLQSGTVAMGFQGGNAFSFDPPEPTGMEMHAEEYHRALLITETPWRNAVRVPPELVRLALTPPMTSQR